VEKKRSRLKQPPRRVKGERRTPESVFVPVANGCGYTLASGSGQDPSAQAERAGAIGSAEKRRAARAAAAFSSCADGCRACKKLREFLLLDVSAHEKKGLSLENALFVYTEKTRFHSKKNS
jgi:hypothetical protein